MENYNDFFHILDDIEEIKKVKHNLINFWGEDYPITLLFSALGKSMVKNFDLYTNNQKEKVFSLVEEVMSNGNDIMKSYVATGFLEALTSEAKRKGVWDKLLGLLGEKSKQYIDAWSKF